MTETIKRLRFPRLRFPVPVVTTLALLVILAAVALSGTAQAQTAITLVSNIGQAEATLSRNPVGQPIGLQFTTGDNAAGYNLDSVEIAVGDYENVVVTVSLYSDSSGEPGSSIFNFTNPTSGITADAVNTFTAPANTTLAGSNTPYFIVFDGANDPDESTNRVRIFMTHTNDEDSGGATNAEGDADWEIADISHALDSGVWYGDDTDELKIRLKGSAKSGGDTPTVSTDATLSALSLGTGVTLSPAFDADTYAYTASVANSVDEVTVTASTTDTDATFEYLDESDATLDDEDTNAAGHQVELDVGDTVFKVKVTAEDGTTTQNYTVTVTRAACTLNDGDLWCGVVDVGTITNSGGMTQSHGFQGTKGDLSDKTFSLMFETGTTNNYTITAIVVGARTAISEQLFFVTSNTLTNTEEESLALHVDGESDPFVWSDSTEVIPGSYRWPARTDLDWSSETTVTLRLREFLRPTVTNVAVTSMPVLETDTYGAGETIEVSVTFSEAVDATSNTDFVLSVGGARRAPLLSGSGTATLVFGYTVVSSDEDTNGIWIGDETRTLVGNRNGEPQNGTITSVATGAAAVIAHTLLGTDSDHKVDGSRTTDNVAPAFTSSATFDAAENQTAAGTVLATDDDTDDSVTGYEITGGADQTIFSIGATSGVLTFDAAPNYEDAEDQGTNNTYVVDVTATSGTGTREMTATQTITVTVTDVDTEAPGKPGAPTVSAASATSLSVSWSAPSNAGPAITDYDVQYRAGTSGDWSDGGHVGTATTATLTGLSEDTSYQVQVRATNAEGTGDWSDSGSGTTDAAASDDCTDDTTTTCEVDVGGSVTGTLETAGDSDWFKVVLEAGTRYQIDLEGADTGRGTLPNPGAILYNRSSANVAFDVNGGVGDNARVIYTPTAAGAHYVQANTASGTGIYTLSVIVLGANGNSEADTDFANNNTTNGKVEVGASVTGRAHPAGDFDRFSVDLEASKTYQFDLEGADTGRGTIEDPFLRLLDGTGNEQLALDDDGGTDANSKIVYTATATGAHYLETRSVIQGGGTYTLSVRDITPAVLPTLSIADAAGDEDDGVEFTATLTAGVSGKVTATWTASIESDDTAVAADLATTKTGEVEFEENARSAKFTVPVNDDTIDENNETFTVTLSGVSSNAQLAADPTAKGTILDDDAAGEGVAVLLSNLGQDTDEFASASVGAFDAAQGFTTGSARSGYFLDSIKLDVQAVPNTPADVTVQLWSASNGNPDASIATLTHSTGSWDTGVNTFSASPAQVLAAETKYFVVLLYSGQRSYLDVNITKIDSADDASTEWEVTGRRLERGSDNQWRRTSGQYLKFSVGGRVTAEGGTDLPADNTTTGEVEVGGSAVRGDIHEPEAETATWIDDDDEVQEQIVYDFDTDWFAVELEEGQTYRIDMKGETPDDDLTLHLPQINAIYNEDGEFLVNTWSRDESDSHYLFRVTFHAHDDGTYYIAASGESHEWGTYELRVKDIRDITEDDDGHTAAQRGLKNLRAVEEKGGVRLTWQPPDGAAVTGYRIERRRAGGQDSGPQRSHGQPRDHHTLVEDTGNTETSYVDESAEQGVEYEYRVTARNESGPGEESDWVRAGPASASNNPATGAPTISGTTQVGETLTADISGIADADGLSGETFTYQWVSSDGTTDTDIENATGSTYTLIAADQGKAIKVRVTFTDDAGNAETLTSTPTEPVLGDGPPGAPVNLTVAAGNKEVTLSWDPPADNGNAPATRYRIEWRVDGKDYSGSQWGTSRSTTYTTNDQANLANGVKYFFRVKAENGSGNSYGPYGPASEEVSVTPTSGSAVDLGTPVLSNTKTLHHGMVQLDWEDIEDAGWYVVQYYHVKSGEWLDLPAAGVDIAFHGSSAVVSNLHGLSWLRVGAASCAGSSEWSQIEELYGTNASDWEGVPVPEVEEGDETEPCPVVLGTPVLSDTEILHHGMVQLDWQDIEDAGWYVVQYYHLEDEEWLDLPAEGVDIAFHGSSAVVSNLHGLSWLRVGAASCDGASEWSQIEESYGTNASDWKGVPVPEVAEGDEIEPCSEDADTPDNSPATGAPTISGTAQVGETLTANTSGVADGDGLSNVQYEYQWLADDADISGATNATYTLTDSEESKAITVRVSFTDDADNGEALTSAATDAVAAANIPATGAPTISGTARVGEVLTVDTSGISDEDGMENASFTFTWGASGYFRATGAVTEYTIQPDDEGKTVDVTAFFIDDKGNWEFVDSAPTSVVEARPNSPATGAPTISGTVRVGETLTADRSGIADADGLSNVQYEYQWLADDTAIQGATDATHTLANTEEGKAIKVQVSFTDDAGNNEALTSAATGAVSAAEPTEPPARPTGLSATASHDSVTLTWDDPGDDSITGYVILRRVRVNNTGGDFSELVADTGTAATTYTDDTVAAGTTYTYRIKAINGAGTSERSRWFHIDTPAAPVPDKPTGLSATASHDSVTLTWEDPGDDSITGYVILRRLRYDDPSGHFDELVADTGDGGDHVHRRYGKGQHSLYLPDQGHQRGRGERAFPLVPHPDPGGPVAGIEDCEGEGAIGTSDGRKLSDELAPTVSGPGR